MCEDDPDIAALLELVLKQAGFTAAIASSARAAEALLARRRFDAMTLDLNLPDRDGIAFLRALRGQAATKDLPIVVVSASALEGRAEIDGAVYGVIDWIGKPINHARLLETLRRAVAHGAAGAPDARRPAGRP